MDSPTNSGAPIVGQSFVEYIRTQRQSVAFFLGVLSAVFLAVSVFLFMKASSFSTEKDKAAEKSPRDDLDLPELPKTVTDLRRS